MLEELIGSCQLQFLNKNRLRYKDIQHHYQLNRVGKGNFVNLIGENHKAMFKMQTTKSSRGNGR